MFWQKVNQLKDHSSSKIFIKLMLSISRRMSSWPVQTQRIVNELLSAQTASFVINVPITHNECSAHFSICQNLTAVVVVDDITVAKFDF